MLLILFTRSSRFLGSILHTADTSLVQMLKSQGLQSGEEGGHMDLSQKEFGLRLWDSHDCVDAGAPFCIKTVVPGAHV